jgi:hypothetical protein
MLVVMAMRIEVVFHRTKNFSSAVIYIVPLYVVKQNFGGYLGALMIFLWGHQLKYLSMKHGRVKEKNQAITKDMMPIEEKEAR